MNIDLVISLQTIIAVLTTAWLVSCGIRNRKTGWRRERSDTVTDILMIWADLVNSKRYARDSRPEPSGAPHAPAPSAPVFISDLTALNAALGAPVIISPDVEANQNVQVHSF